MSKENAKYERMCQEILRLVPLENIQDVFHCTTRLRLVVKDASLVDAHALEMIDGVVKVKEVGNQFQLVIGTEVANIYQVFCELTGLDNRPMDPEDEGDSTERSQAKEGLSSIAARCVETLSAIFLPITRVLVAGGVLKSVVMLLTTFGVLPAEGGTALVISAIADAPYYYLPFFVGLTTARRFRLKEIWGLMIAGTLMYPTFLNQTSGESLEFLFFSVPAYSYASTALPTLLCVIAFSYLFRLVDRIMPNNLKLIFSGAISFAIFLPVLLAVVAPLGNWCGQALSGVTNQMFETLGPLAGALIAGPWSLMVLVGMHTALFPLMVQNLNDFGFDFLLPAALVNNLAVAGAVIGASFKIRDPKMRLAARTNGMLCLFPVSEPALYTICTTYRQPLIATVVGGVVGGALYMLLGVRCYAFATPGMLSLPAYYDGGYNLLFAVLSMLAAFVAAFVYSYFMTRDNNGD